MMSNGSKIYNFLATSLFCIVKEWPHSSGNINEWPLNYKELAIKKAKLRLLWDTKTVKQLLWDVKQMLWDKKACVTKVALLDHKVLENVSVSMGGINLLVYFACWDYTNSSNRWLQIFKKRHLLLMLLYSLHCLMIFHLMIKGLLLSFRVQRCLDSYVFFLLVLCRKDPVISVAFFKICGEAHVCIWWGFCCVSGLVDYILCEAFSVKQALIFSPPVAFFVMQRCEWLVVIW